MTQLGFFQTESPTLPDTIEATLSIKRMQQKLPDELADSLGIELVYCKKNLFATL
jgi:hypothetical protein